MKINRYQLHIKTISCIVSIVALLYGAGYVMYYYPTIVLYSMGGLFGLALFGLLYMGLYILFKINREEKMAEMDNLKTDILDKLRGERK